MLEQLGLQPDPDTVDFQREIKEWHPVPPGTEVAKKSNLFPRQEVRVQQAAGAEAATASATGASAESELAQPVDFSDFQKLDLRIGRVLAAERVPKADKLLRLEVDVGQADKRQIVAGLAERFEPEGLVGRQVVVVANLKPRKIRGQTSQGMVLAVHDQAGLQLVEPAGEVQPGSKVS
jgi:methionyl-tRNA synthetase